MQRRTPLRQSGPPRMPRLAWIAFPLMLGASGCSGSTPELCLIDRPILVDRADVLTDATVTEILRHNERYEAVCR